MNLCTIVAKNYLAHARVLARSYKEHHPEGTFYVLVVDETEGYVNPAEEPFVLVRPSELGIEGFEHMAGIYDVVELSTAVKPWFLKYLLDRGGMERVAYFDPDIRIFDRLDRLDELTREYGLVLIPHITDPMPRDGEKPTEADILIAGTYNLGFMALERSARSIRLLDWWSERLRNDCVVAPEKGYFVDQRWIDFVHGVMPGFYALRDPGYNVAYWNLHGREVTRKGGRYLVNGEPLRFFHFSGYDPRRPDRLSKHQSRTALKNGSALKRVCDEYADALLENGFEAVKDWPYGYGVLPNGVKLDPGMHRLYRAGHEAGELDGSIFTPEGANRFVAWLNEPAPVGGEYGVTRYLYEIYEQRPDVRQAFPNLDGPDAAGFIGWTQTHGNVETPTPHHPAAEGDGQGPVSSDGVNVAGYFRSELGVGEVARQLTAALQTQDVPVATVGISTRHSRQGHDYETDTVEPAFPVNLICVNADALPGFANRAGARLFEERYSIGMWWWEVNEFPERSMEAFKYVDEVWVGSHHVADAVAKVSPVPVVKITVPLSMPPIEEMSREELGLPEGFLFMFSFDYHSVFERKNPLAVVEAFKRAFPQSGSGASLVVKSINGDAYPERHAKLTKAAEDHPDVYVVDRYVSFGEKNAMAAACDCYVSLHRSEGFGFTMAEPMYLGKPVIATAYSGNTDFMNARNSYLVDYELVPIGEGADPYPPTAEWAEPDVDHAAALMRGVFEDPEEARERGGRAAADMRRTHSPEAAGSVMARRLESIRSRLVVPQAGGTGQVAARRPAARPSGLKTERLEHNIAHTPRPVASPSLPGRAMGLVRRVALKTMWPFAMQQRIVNEQMLTTIKGVDMSLREVAHRLESHIKKLESRSPDILSRIEKLGAQLQSIYPHIEETERLAVHVEAADRLVSETRVLPYMADSPFETFDDPAAGSVFGYAARNGPSASAGTYDAFEDIFRGPEDFIRDRQRRYLDLLGDRDPVLDVGCGRGEFLDLLRERGVEYTGIDLDPDMVERCRRKGHQNVEVADATSYLEKMEDDSLGVIFCAQVIEHLPYEVLLRFFELAERKLEPGGLLIAETVNPHSVAALKAFWVDPSHQHPVFPEVALALSRINGFEKAYVFHPNGTGNVEKDRYETGEYAVVATKAAQGRGG